MKFGFGRSLSKVFSAQKKITRLIETALKPVSRQTARARSKSSRARFQLLETTGFGSNPGRLVMKSYVPPRLQSRPALVVVLHGCLQTAESLDAASGLSRLAKERGFVLLYPQQQRMNNSQCCFNWFRPSAVARDRGEVLSIKQMVDHACERHRINHSKVFVVGLSAGGAMTAALVANYPGLFAGAAIIAGMPFGTARDAMSAVRAMKDGASLPAGGWGRPVVDLDDGSKSWPSLTIWQGKDDRVVNPVNAQACVAQWLDALGIEEKSGQSQEKSWGDVTVWADGGAQRVAYYSVRNLGHGMPVKKRENALTRGSADPYVIPTGISAPAELMRLWRLGRLT